MAKKINKLTDLGIPNEPFKALTEDMRKNEAQSKSLAVAQEVLSQSLKENAKEAERLRKALRGKTVTDAQGVKEYNALQKESQKIIKENEQLKAMQLRNAKLEEDLLQKKLRTEKMLNSEKIKTLNLYQQESARLNKLRNDYKNLAVQNKENSKEARILLREITALDTKLKKIDATVGQHQRSVGNYTRALGGLRNMLGQVGLAFGAGYILQSIAGTEIKLQSLRLAIKNVTSSNAEYEQSLRFIKELSLSYGQDLVVLTDTYKNFIASSKASGLDLKERQRIYESIIKSGSALALSNEQIEGSLLAVSQMFSKGNIQAEELRGQLSERLPGSFGLMAKAMGVTEQELNKLLKEGKVLAKDALPLLATELEKTFGAKAQENLKTVGGAWNRFTTSVSEYTSKANEGGRITRFLAGALIKVADNIGLIVTTLKTAIILWTTYKARLIAVNVAQALFANNTGKLVFSFKQLRENLTQGESATKRFGGALKSIGWTVIIALVAELSYEIYKLATGMAVAQYRTEQYALALEKVQKKMSENSEKRAEKLRVETNQINLSNKSDAEKLRLIKALNEQAKQELESDVKRLTVKHKLANATRLEFIAKRDAYKAQVYGSGIGATAIETATMISLEKMVTKTTVAEKAFREMLTQTKSELVSYDQAVVDNTVSLNESEKATTKETTAKEKAVKVQKQLNLEKENAISLEEEFRLLMPDGDINALFEGEYQRNVLATERSRIFKEIELSEARKNKLSDEAVKKLEEELLLLREKEIIAKAELEIKQATSDLEIQMIKVRADQEIYNLRNGGESENENLEKRAELYNNLGQAVELSSDAIIKSIDKRIEAVDREIEAQKKLQDLIQQGAEQGSENANKSLAEAQEAQRQAEIEKAKLEQRKQRVLMITAFLTSYTKNMEEGMSSGESFAKALADKATVEALISSMPAYLDGIEDTGTVNNPLDKNGGRVALLHDNERVVSAKENKELIKMGVSNSDLPYYVRQGMLMENTSFQNIEQSLELNGLTKKLDEVVNVIKNKPETTWNANTVVDGVLSLTRTTKRGNQIINNRFNYRA